MTIKQYALAEGITTAGVYLRVKRGTLKSKVENGLRFVYVYSDKTIKKPRKK